MTDKKRPHHHGNLREALILAGVALLEEQGAEALSLRKCAARAGVSHGAPAHHFKGLAGLKTAIIARGHGIFASFMRNAQQQAAPDPHAQLRAICEGYVEFARHHGALFKFMFQAMDKDPALLDPVTHAEFLRESGESYRILQDACAPFETGKAGSLGTEIMIWSLVHGYAMLFCDTVPKFDPGVSIPDFSQILPVMKLKDNG